MSFLEGKDLIFLIFRASVFCPSDENLILFLDFLRKEAYEL
jgi:hypothetical protein